VDSIAIKWREKAILLGECKWGADTIGRSVIRELIEKTPRVVPGEDWKVYYAFFARAGFFVLPLRYFSNFHRCFFLLQSGGHSEH
jgi:hypothetical protein